MYLPNNDLEMDAETVSYESITTLCVHPVV